jgi:hypothetical protein
MMRRLNLLLVIPLTLLLFGCTSLIDPFSSSGSDNETDVAEAVWTDITPTLESDVIPVRVVTHPTDASRLYLHAKRMEEFELNGQSYSRCIEHLLYYSSDGGSSWGQSSVPLSDWKTTGPQFDPADANKAYMVVVQDVTDTDYHKLMVTSDGGATFSEMPGSSVSNGIPSWYGNVFRFESDPSIYLCKFGGMNGGLLVSSDNGVTWTEVTAGVEGAALHTLAQSEAESDVVFAIGAGVYRSADAGATWQAVIEPGMINENGAIGVPQLAVSKADPGVLYAATSAGLWSSDDNGLSWGQTSWVASSEMLTGVAVKGDNLFYVINNANEIQHVNISTGQSSTVTGYQANVRVSDLKTGPHGELYAVDETSLQVLK